MDTSPAGMHTSLGAASREEVLEEESTDLEGEDMLWHVTQSAEFTLLTWSLNWEWKVGIFSPSVGLLLCLVTYMRFYAFLHVHLTHTN